MSSAIFADEDEPGAAPAPPGPVVEAPEPFFFLLFLGTSVSDE